VLRARKLKDDLEASAETCKELEIRGLTLAGDDHLYLVAMVAGNLLHGRFLPSATEIKDAATTACAIVRQSIMAVREDKKRK
jgi:hypothetical protein